MELTEKQFYELIGRMVAHGVIKEEPKKYLIKSMKKLPYEWVRNSSGEHPIFEPDTFVGDSWKSFLNLAKLLHKQSPKFHMSETLYGKPYIRYDKQPYAPKTVTDLTLEQQLLSIEMLNEMIPIWNKYFAKAHPTVWYDAKGNGDFQKVKVLYEDGEE